VDELLTGPLHDRHVALGATLGAFGGWQMPISYPGGTVAEHNAVRAALGLFDVSHLGKLAIAGPGAAAFVNRCFTADLEKIGPGQAQYTLCCTAEGGVVDDVIVYLVGPDEVLAVPNAANAAQVAQLLRAAAPAGVEPAGLAARDTLRTEMGYPLHGQDLSVDITPVQAGSGWAVGWSKPEFWGRDALTAEKAAGPARRLRGLRAVGRGVPRPGMTVLRDGAPVGTTTSGTFSPSLKTGIALALIDSGAGVALDDTVTVDVRGRALECVVVKPPFVPSHVR
jgi:glycine cleavage system aminomethyltransferase T